MTNKKRIEFDSLGSKKIDQNKLWGAQTQRSLENFKIGTTVKVDANRNEFKFSFIEKKKSPTKKA